MDAPPARPSPVAAPPLIDAYEAFWNCQDDLADAAVDDAADTAETVDAYAAFQAINDGN